MDYDIIVEPSAGSGAFSDKLVCYAYDLHPDKPGIIKQDFLRLKVTGSIEGKRILFVGNPPYGKSARLAIQFINHAYSLGATDIAFVLPKTMLRYSAQRRVNSDLKLTTSIDLPKNSFALDGKICDVPSVFQIWSRDGECNRARDRLNSHPELEILDYSTDDDEVPEFDIAIKRYGRVPAFVYPGESFGRAKHWFLVRGDVDKIKQIDLHKINHNDRIMPRCEKSDIYTEYDSMFGSKCLRASEPVKTDLEVHIFQKQQPSYKWLDWDYDMAIARCEANPTVIMGARVTDDRHWLLVKGDVECLIGVDWSKYQDDKMTAGISVGDVKAAYEGVRYE